MTTPTDATETPVTRAEVAAAVSDLFGTDPIDASDMIAAAAHSGARAQVVEALELLPETKSYASLRQLWPDLPDMPVR